MLTPILQFGTSRFLQAHADLFISEALERGDALGPIAVVQTTDNPSSHARVTALAAGGGYPVQIRGRQNGQIIDTEQRCTGIRAAYHAGRDWAVLRRMITGEVQVILSNTGDAGYALHPADGPSLLLPGADAPRSFPAKLLVLLHDRWQAGAAPLSVFPCELISRNGDTLRGIVQNLALTWGMAAGFNAYLSEDCRWANSLVDRIVSEPIEPVGAVAEPYALWAIEAQAGLTLPCRHPALQIVPDLAVIERLKLHLLNLGHTYLADGWLRQARAAGETVFQAIETPTIRADLEAIWTEEVLPVFAAWGLGAEATAYLADVRDRFLNPFLKHRLADIAQNHADKRLRRLAPLVAAAENLGLTLPQPRLRAVLG
ncbi:mannitol dehydrogenase family protein [Elstera cyanobacteriorum]|uniref:mannitol dehydrogenase family protein n=1 Tax=Elstera cyanobacteriorum TaxID=2022747 RepID=UPI002357C442|nr:mannitol dehydrogenase family protein [Elstera cyanobacteriorum]MCK6444200.1 mannitol dehydrogenase family protein [Elstera cyanobacteriorum]